MKQMYQLAFLDENSTLVEIEFIEERVGEHILKTTPSS